MVFDTSIETKEVRDHASIIGKGIRSVGRRLLHNGTPILLERNGSMISYPR